MFDTVRYGLISLLAGKSVVILNAEISTTRWTGDYFEMKDVETVGALVNNNGFICDFGRSYLLRPAVRRGADT